MASRKSPPPAANPRARRAVPVAPDPSIRELPLRDIDAADETFRQRAIIAIDDLVTELRVTPQQVPIFVRERADGRYQIIAGFRRVHALKELGRAHAKAVVLACDDAEAWRLAWAENVAHRRLRGVDLSYFVFRLHDAGHNAEEIARLCSMSERDAARVEAVGRLPPTVRALVRDHDLTLRHGAIIAAFMARHPRIDVVPTVAAAAQRGLGEAHFAGELEALARRRAKRKVVGVTFRDAQRISLDLGRAQPSAWSDAVQKRMRALAAWLEDALVEAEAAAATPSGARRRRRAKDA